MLIDEKDVLHYGIIRRSGRYPWGSGGNEDQHNKQLLDYVKDQKDQGLTEGQIARGMDMSIADLRAEKSRAVNQQRQANIAMAQRLKDKGYSTTAIGRRMGNVPEATVRSWLAPGAKDKADVLENTANMLRAQVDEKSFVDVGKGVENYVGVSSTKMDTALSMLKMEGYEVHKFRDPQTISGHATNKIVLCKPGTTQKEAFLNRDNVQQIKMFSDDGGRSFSGLHEPLVINPKRIDVVYKEDGGNQADGVIYVRRGVDDVTLGGATYAQVRVAVGKDHYLKGMAMYKDDLPDGVDLQFNTNKSSTGNKLDAMKKNTEEKGYIPGGEHVLLKSIRRQIVANPGMPNEKVTSAMNIVNEEGKWEKWSRNLSSQMLSKQSPSLAKTQLDMTYERRQQEYDDIKKLTNATVRKKLLMDFSDKTDSAAVHLKAAALPRQGSHVILPVSTMPPNQIYAPNFLPGERVALIRHPHGGTFEIPDLIVNNNHAESKRLLGNARDAVGIHHSVAERLSGADFDGDTVLVIPNDRNRLTITPALEDLKGFDPRASYPAYEGMKTMRNTEREMGEISNLITDMSLKNAPIREIARAVKHSMVVIDAEKHNLNYKLSANDNNIKQLKQKYQGKSSGGASTIISRAGARAYIDERKPRTRSKGGPVNLDTGALAFEPTNRKNKETGQLRKSRFKRLAVTEDARTLMSPNASPMERLYANHSNRLKALANEARLTSIRTHNPKQSSSARKAYAPQVKSLDSKLTISLMNAPLERQANVIANTNVKAKRAADPNMDEDTLKKIKYQALTEARRRTGAEKQRIEITNDEWDAIQAGAVSHSKLTQILNYADMEIVRQHATPKTPVLMTATKTKRAESMLESGYTRAEVARQLGVSLSTLDAATKE